jgi:predicted ATPase
LFDRLSVFVGGGSLSAIELVCGAEPNDRIAELVEEQEQVATSNALPPRRRLYSQLLSLVEKSLLRHTITPDSEERFWMLETMREYASEQLARKEETSTIQERHAAYYGALVHVAVPILMGKSSQLGWISRLDRDYNNLRAALDWSIQSSPNDEQALRFADDLYLFWILAAPTAKGVTIC